MRGNEEGCVATGIDGLCMVYFVTALYSPLWYRSCV